MEKYNFRKKLKNKVILIKDGVELERARDVLAKNGQDVIMGYDETYAEDKFVNSGYLHCYYSKFYLSKNILKGHTSITIEDFEKL